MMNAIVLHSHYLTVKHLESFLKKFNSLTDEGFSETGPSMRFGNHVFRSQ